MDTTLRHDRGGPSSCFICNTHVPLSNTARDTARVQSRAETVIVGAGIVGASAAYHLAELGVTDVLVMDQGPLFETGDRPRTRPGLVFQTNGSRTMCRIAQDTVALYDGLDLDGEPGAGTGSARSRSRRRPSASRS